MKKVRKYILPTIAWTVVMLPFVCIAACLISAAIPENPLKLASSMLDVKLPWGTTVLINHDTGPGLPIPGGASNGYTFMILQIPPEKVAEFKKTLETSPVWKPLPLPQEFEGHEDEFQPSFGIEEMIPITTSTGYYFFIDYQEEYNKRKGEQIYDTSKPFYERRSENCTFGMFNDKDGKLYLWNIDT
jgi:hypothetical protein